MQLPGFLGCRRASSPGLRDVGLRVWCLGGVSSGKGSKCGRKEQVRMRNPQPEILKPKNQTRNAKHAQTLHPNLLGSKARIPSGLRLEDLETS